MYNRTTIEYLHIYHEQTCSLPKKHNFIEQVFNGIDTFTVNCVKCSARYSIIKWLDVLSL